MSASRPGLLRRLFFGLWWLVDGSRRLLLNLLFLALVGALLFFWLRGVSAPGVKDKTVLVLDIAGPVLEQRTGSAREQALAQLRGEAVKSTLLRDVVGALDAAAADPKIDRALLLLDDFDGAGLPTLREIAGALERFRASGKTVSAWAANYDQRSYYLAAHADEVFLHPMGAVYIEGYGRLRNYYADAFARLGVRANVVRAGTFKSAFEVYSANAPSKETLTAEAFVYDALWSQYTQGVERARKLPAGAIAKGIEELPARLAAARNDPARLALDSKLVDKLLTRDELRRLLVERGTSDDAGKSPRQISLQAYAARHPPKAGGDAIGVIVAQGVISDGDAPPGAVGGRSTAELVRRAREDERIKAIVLRVDSPGGSAYGSELVRRELELTRAAGKPVVVSMGNVAASGGYWISLAADEVIADPATITGSIGVVGMLPTGEGLMDKLSLRVGGYSTTWLASAYDPRKALDPRFAALVQTVIGHVYQDFTGRVASARKMPREAVDAVASGRIWTGAQAVERGLVDRTGSFGDALKAAATLAKLEPGHGVRYIERPQGLSAQLFQQFGGGALADLALTVGVDLMGGTGGPGLGAVSLLPAGAAQALRGELAWLTELAGRREPFAAVVHCMCAPVW